jgi:hypothetical protein
MPPIIAIALDFIDLLMPVSVWDDGWVVVLLD